MLIIDRTYFTKSDCYIPHAKDDITDSITGVKNNLDADIAKYEREILLKALGYSLFKEFTNNLDYTQSNGLIIGADAKWDWLLNGYEYTINGKLFYYRGIRFKDDISLNNENWQSFIAYYVFWFYLKEDSENYGGVGIQKEVSANSMVWSANNKLVKAWRSFYELLIGDYNNVTYTYNYNGLTGISYFVDNSERSLYQFIRDMNILTPDTYADWQPSFFENVNTFGL